MGGGHVDVDELGRRAGALAWLERRRFEVLGGWVQAVADHEVKVQLAEASRLHAWHAELWEDLLPRTAAHDRLVLVGPPRGLDDVVDAVAASDDDVLRLVAAHRVLGAHVLAALGGWELATTTAADGPTRRVLRLVLTDQRDEREAGERALLRLLRQDPAAVPGAAAHQRSLEVALLGASLWP